MSSYSDLPRPYGLYSVPARMLDEQDADLDNLPQSTSPLLPAEIPDSQPSFNEIEISDSQQARDFRERYLTHSEGISRVHAHHNFHQIGDQLNLDLEDERPDLDQHEDHNSLGFANEERAEECAIAISDHSEASPSEQRSPPSSRDQYVGHVLIPRLRNSYAKVCNPAS